MTHTTQTLIAIDTALRAANGDFRATERALARFCTEALVDCAEQALASLTQAETAKFAITVSDRFARHDREWSISALCSYVHAERLRAWGEAFEASCAAARAEFPSAYEAIGAAL